MQSCADICIIGAGPVGLALAAALKRRGPRRDVVVLDRGDPREDDGKSVAFGPRARKFLQELDAWPEAEKPVRRAEISFGPPGRFRPLNLRNPDADALAFVAPHEEIRAALLAQVREQIRSPAPVADLRDQGDFVQAVLRDGEEIRARLMVVACATPHAPEGFAAREFDYGQSAIALVGEVENPDGWDADAAYERFSPEGVLTLAPRAGRSEAEVGAVICASAAVGAKWNGLADADLSAKLSAALGGRFRIRVGGARKVYAPQLRRVSPLGLGRMVRIGQAATIVHPIGAQGLNLALRDADALSQLLAESDAAGPAGKNFAQSSGGAAAEFARRRSREHSAVAAATHSLALLARRRWLPMRIAGGLFCALAAADFAAPMRDRLAKGALGNY